MTEQKQIIRWEEPPPPLRGEGGGGGQGVAKSQYSAIAEDLRANPGRWAVVEECETSHRTSTGLASKISNGHYLAFTPAGDFEARGRRRGSVLTTYARYLGDGEAS